MVTVRCLMLLFLAAAALFASPRVEAQRVDSAIAIGQSIQFYSETLQEQRRIFIYLPVRYAQARASYPVLYLLDAEEHFHHATGIVQFLAANGRIPEMIVVGITNTNRDRDLTPPTHEEKEQSDTPEAGGADRFLQFAGDELVPWVESHYRAAPFRILAGHSLGGLLNIYALLSRPKTFQAHIAVSPSLWWDGGRYVDRAEQEFGRLASPHFLYLSCGDHETIISTPTEKLAAWLKEHPMEGLEFGFRHYEGERHGTTPHRSLYEGLEKIFAGWELSYDPHDDAQHPDLAAVEAHYAKLSRRYGYKIDPSADDLADVAEQMLKRHQHAQALPLCERNAAEHPEAPVAQECLGEALEAAGRYDEAQAAYQRALRLTLEGEHPYGDALGDYRRHAAELAKKRPAP